MKPHFSCAKLRRPIAISIIYAQEASAKLGTPKAQTQHYCSIYHSLPLTMAYISSLKKPLSLPLLAFIITICLMLLLHTVNSANTLSFSFDEFDRDQNKDLIVQGDAFFTIQRTLTLTRRAHNGNPLGNSVGRVLYSAPIRLWDGSGGLASFESNFTFTISRYTHIPTTGLGDGLTFFIASPDTTIPPASTGAFLGLFSNASRVNNTHNDRVVAVEFDTYPNLDLGDPNYGHIGVNVNSIRSSAVTRWDSQSAQTATAHISYSSSSRRLRVFLSYLNGYSVDFTYHIDLATVLPQWVRVGFSASTGWNAQVTDIRSWSFSSVYQRNINVREEDGNIASVV